MRLTATTLVEILERRVDERNGAEPHLGDAGVAVHHVEPAERVDRSLHRRSHVVGIGHVGARGHRRSARRTDLLGDALHVRGDDVGGDDLGPFRCEQPAGLASRPWPAPVTTTTLSSKRISNPPFRSGCVGPTLR